MATKKPIKIETVEEKVSKPRTIIYIIQCENLKFNGRSCWRGEKFYEHNVPAWVKDAAKELSEVYPIWRDRLERLIAESESQLKGHVDELVVKRIQTTIDVAKAKLADYPDKYTDADIFAELEIPVLKTVE